MRTHAWTNGLALAAAALVWAGVVVCGAAWYTAGTEGTLSDQIGAANLSVLGPTLIGMAATVWLVAARSAVTRRTRRLTARAETVIAGLAAEPPRPQTAGIASLVTNESMGRYHRAMCPLVRGKHVHDMSPAERSSRVACGVCEP